MEIIKGFISINYISYFAATLIFIAGIVFIFELIEKISIFINRPVRWVKKKNEDHEIIKNITEKIDTFEKNRLKDLELSTKNDEEIKKMLDSTIRLLEGHIKTDNERTIVTLRSTLYDMHTRFIANGYVTNEGLKTFLECGNAYEEAGGNDIYHDKLKPEILNLPIKNN